MNTELLRTANELEDRLYRVKANLECVKKENAELIVFSEDRKYLIKNLSCFEEIKRMITNELQQTAERLQKEFEEM